MSGDEKIQSLGGQARAKKLTKQRRAEIARKAAETRWGADGASTALVAHYGAPERPLKIGSIEIPCYVLSDGTRLLAQRGLQSGIGMSEGGGPGGARKIAAFMARLADKGIDIRGLVARVKIAVADSNPPATRPRPRRIITVASITGRARRASTTAVARVQTVATASPGLIFVIFADPTIHNLQASIQTTSPR
jgi:hypothetical protein